MGFLAGKKILITGLLSDRSIAYGVAKACQREGATLAFTYQMERFRERTLKLANNFNTDFIIPCDVTNDEEINNMAKTLGEKWDGLDGILHSIAFSEKDGLSGDFVNNVTRDIFAKSNDVSAYSFIALARALRPMMQGRDAALVTLSYLGANRVVPNYNMMGVAKAALEAAIRYMASSLGNDGIRVNGVSAGPIKTLAASGISGFSKILDQVEKQSILKRNVSIDEVGNVAAFLFSHLSSGMSGEVLYVDSGYSHTTAIVEECV